MTPLPRRKRGMGMTREMTRAMRSLKSIPAACAA